MQDDLDSGKWEQARTVVTTEHLLRRYHFQQICAAACDDETVPSLTLPQIHLIVALRERGSLTIKQIAQVLSVKAPAASAMVDRLVEVGILVRTENPADRREVLVRISPSQEPRLHELERRHLQAAVGLLNKLGPKHARMWSEVCRRIQDILSKEQGE